MYGNCEAFGGDDEQRHMSFFSSLSIKSEPPLIFSSFHFLVLIFILLPFRINSI